MKLAFVVPWYGRDIPGGAEALTYQTATRLKQAGHAVEVLTTCIRDLYWNWNKNFHKPGTEIVDSVPVRRFRVRKTNRLAFSQVNGKLMQGRPITAEEEWTFINEMFHCPDLFDYIQKHQNEYLYIFIPYMFATTYWGAQIAPQRSIMIPCLHDEGYAHLNIHQQVIPQTRALLFLAHAESQLANRIFPNTSTQIRTVVGSGINTDWRGHGQQFRQKYGLGDSPFVLYAGRREPGKNTHLLIRYCQRYQELNNTSVKLVLIGPGDVSVPPNANIVDLGFVPKQDKYDAYAAANVFCMPSVHESFSISVMESWLAGTPVLVHGNCAVTREHCLRANGGLYFSNYPEFAAALDYLLAHTDTAVTLGQQGRQYVLENYTWETVIDRYTAVIKQVLES
jgi:glycosyltransferase involved in cell wall biosynthesis